MFYIIPVDPSKSVHYTVAICVADCLAFDRMVPTQAVPRTPVVGRATGFHDHFSPGVQPVDEAG